MAALKQIPSVEIQAVLAYKQSAECQAKKLCGDQTHGVICDPTRCVFWRYLKTDYYVCKRSANHVHRCGSTGQCDSMILAPQGESFVCPYTGITSNEQVLCLWGIQQQPDEHHGSAHSVVEGRHKRRKIAEGVVKNTISTQIRECIIAFLDDTPKRRQVTHERRIQMMYDNAISFSPTHNTPQLQDVLKQFTSINQPLLHPEILTPERTAWLTTTITDYFARLKLPGVTASSKKKLHAFAVTCLLHLQVGERDMYDIEMFPRVPWLVGALKAIEVGRLSTFMRCSTQEQIWSSMCVCISKHRNDIVTYTFMQPYTAPIPP